MKEIVLCKFGEVVLKGLNRSHFEAMMMADLRRRLKHAGDYAVECHQSVAFIEGADEDADMDEAERLARTVFGIVQVSRAVACDKNMDAIREAVEEYAPLLLRGARTFKCESKRADKNFPLRSPELSAEVGAMVLSTLPRVRVNVQNPDIVLHVEVRDRVYLHGGSLPGAGGVPAGSAGKALLLLSGGIDSPVAGYMMARRGAEVEALHFESFPYTSERAKEKVLRLAEELTAYTGRMKVHVISLTHIQEELVHSCEEEYFTLLLRRFMMRLAEKVAEKRGCAALITGESLGQVASQTLPALTVTDAAVERPVFRPCIGMDKEEIVQFSRKIGTFDTSIEPYEDCCTVFTPKHPKTRPEPEKVIAQEEKLDIAALEEEAMASLETHYVSIYR